VLTEELQFGGGGRVPAVRWSRGTCEKVERERIFSIGKRMGEKKGEKFFRLTTSLRGVDSSLRVSKLKGRHDTREGQRYPR